MSDFSLSEIIPIISNDTTTERYDSIIGGTLFYYPPEGFSGKSKTFKSDIWSLGVSLYEMAQLELPFEGNFLIFKNNVLFKSPKNISNFYSKELNILIMKMLTKDPLKRPTAKDCMLFIPRIIRNKYAKPLIPNEIEEEFIDLYSIIYDFPNLSCYNLICPLCKDKNKEDVFPLIKINIKSIRVYSVCKGGHFNDYDIKDFYKTFTDQRLERKEDICSLCGKENEFPDEIVYRFCYNCKSILCRRCEKQHKAEFSEHKIYNEFINENSTCLKHNKRFSKFCNDCLINLCEDCLLEHINMNIGHSIKEIENINDGIINKEKENIEEIKNYIIEIEEKIKATNSSTNKYYLLHNLNTLKLFVLFKYTLLKLYEETKSNYIINKNFLENNYKIFRPHLYIFNGNIQDIFTPKFYRSIQDFDNKKLKKEKKFEDMIVDIIRINKNQLLIFLKSEIMIINDLSSLKEESIAKLDIDNVIQLKNGKFLISHLNELKIFTLSRNEKNEYTFDIKYKFANFTNDDITTFIELGDEKLVILAGGHLTVFIKKNDVYEMYKNNFYLKEKIYSIININKEVFASISEINGEEFCCHIQIWDSKNIELIYNSLQHYHFKKNKNVGIKYDNESIILIAGRSPKTDFINSLLVFNSATKDYNILKLLSGHELLNLFPISENCFILYFKTMENYYLYQYEYIDMNPTWIGSTELDNKEINKVLIIENNLIISYKEGRIVIYN